MNKKILKIAYIVIMGLALALPGIGTLIFKSDSIGNESREELSDMNYLNFSTKFDSYFSQNFGLRGELINMNNRLKYGLFKQSGEKSVIAGKDGWLFYGEAIHDYTGEDLLADCEIAEIADMLKNVQDYVESRGVKFVFVSAPNKMEIYGENMPYYCVENADDGNYEHLMAALLERGVNYVDLKEILRGASAKSDTLLYHKLDSHWNNLGASIAYNAIMSKTGMKAYDYSSEHYTIQDIFSGDLYGMLFPKGDMKDWQVVFDRAEEFYYTSNFRGVDDLIIDTANDGGNGSVLMFRDSFGNALYPFFANDFLRAEFSRALPYDLTDIDGYDIVVVEIVERNIGNLLEYPPVIEVRE